MLEARELVESELWHKVARLEKEDGEGRKKEQARPAFLWGKLSPLRAE